MRFKSASSLAAATRRYKRGLLCRSASPLCHDASHKAAVRHGYGSLLQSAVYDNAPSRCFSFHGALFFDDYFSCTGTLHEESDFDVMMTRLFGISARAYSIKPAKKPLSMAADYAGIYFDDDGQIYSFIYLSAARIAARFRTATASPASPSPALMRDDI